MIKFDGVKLEATDYLELQEFARKIGLSRSWIHIHPTVYYDVICSFKARTINNYIEKRERLETKKKETWSRIG